MSDVLVDQSQELWEMVKRGREAEKRKYERQLSKLKDSGLDVDFQKRNDEIFDPKTTLLNKGNFTIPGLGQQPDYCHTKTLSHFHITGNSAASTFKTCKLWRCPSCAHFKIDSEVFKHAVALECYSLVTGDRPFRYVGSMHTETVDNLTLTDIRNFNRNVKDRVKRQGVNAGLQIFHPLRLIKKVQDAIRYLNGDDTSSGGFWSFIQDPANIQKINDYLGTNYRNWRDCTVFSPHIHGLGFPGKQKITGDKKVVIAKLQAADGSYTLDSVRDVVKHIRYLMTHCGVLVNIDDDSRLKPANPFGDLHNWKPEDFLTPEQIREIQSDVLQILNEKRTKPYSVNDKGELCYLGEESNSDEKLKDKGYYPLKDFDAYDEYTAECQDAWLKSIKDQDNRDYVEYLISERSRILKDKTIPQKLRCLFLKDLRDPPDNFEIIELDW